VDIVQHLRTFVCIVDSGSISRAARKLRLSVAMASRHLRGLERELDVTLLRRTTRRMDLTPAGAELLPRARKLLADLDEARQAVRPTNAATGHVTLSVPVSFGLAHVAPLVPRLLERHPLLSVEVRYEDHVVDLLADGVDLAIRVGVAPPDSPFVLARRLATYERILCAAPAFLERQGAIEDVEALERLPCLLLGPGTRWDLGARTVAVSGRARSNNVAALRGAALGGAGVALMPRWLVEDDLRARRLIRVLPNAKPPDVDVLSLTHTDTRHSRTLRLLQDFLATELGPRGSERPRRASPRGGRAKGPHDRVERARVRREPETPGERTDDFGR